MANYFASIYPFNTEEDLKRISARMVLYTIPRNWKDLSEGGTLLREIYMGNLLGAAAGEFIEPSKHYRKSLWEYRELVQTSNCVRLGAEHFARGEARGAKDVPEFRGGKHLPKDIQAAYDIGRYFNGFLAVARGLLVCSVPLESANVKQAFADFPEEFGPSLRVIKKNEKRILGALAQVVNDIEKENISIDVEDAYAVIKEIFPGIGEKSIKSMFGKSFRAARIAEKHS